ncbi:MAG TPA: RNA polymerase sigma factor [candidate division Zixibacteria bacterium]|nr:RNA polymerase sigma factor [candidate division Zixibacteria bacterium]
MEESELIDKIKKDENAAFRTFYEIYKDMIYNVCYRILNDKQDAEDVTQDVFVKAIHSVHQFRGNATISTWLYQIAVNTSLNYFRRKKIIKWLSLDFLMGKEEYFLDNSKARPDLELEKTESEALIRYAIHSLPARQRTAIILQRYEGLSYREIAEIMKTSLSAVESLIHHAKDNLSKKILPLLE